MASQPDQPKITLHWLEVSRAHRILWLLEELGIQYELKTYKRLKTKWAEPALKQVHPLGKSPVVTVELPGQAEPVVLAESGAITEYLCDYFAKNLVPKRYKDGQEGKIGQETESWLRYRFFMHYAEGSIMPWTLFSFILDNVQSAPIPFFVKPIVNLIVGQVRAQAVTPQLEAHYQFIEDQLKTSPNGGQARSGMTDRFSPVWQYVDRLHNIESYKRAVKKIEEVEGSFKTDM